MLLKNTAYISFSLFFFLFVEKTSAQCAGAVANSQKLAVANATVTIRSKHTDSIIAFAFTDKDGLFSFSCPALTDTLILSVSHLSYKKRNVALTTTASAKIEIVLEEETKALPEVVVRNKGIFQRGDTLNYLMSQFVQKQDMVIADVLRRLPGIEVTDNGIVKYHGRAINKYYIEGLDLLDDRYNIANQNIPAEAVSSVQVIENHQPVKALDSFTISNQAALNIKLKNGYKGKIFGRGKAGIGGAPLLADIEFVPMKFGDSEQGIAIYKYNNTGKDYAQELDQLYLNESTNSVKGNLFVQPLSYIPFPAAPSMTKERSLFNNLQMGSFNFLKKISNDYEWKFQLDAVSDKQRQWAGNVITHFFTADTIRIAETQEIVRHTQMWRGSTILTSNTNNRFLKNVLSGEIKHIDNEGVIANNTLLNQKLSLAASNIRNDFSFLKTRNNTVQGASSFLSYQHQPEDLYITPGIYPTVFNNNLDYTRLLQTASISTFFTNNFVRYGFKWKKMALEQRAGFSFLQQKLFSSLNIESANSIKQADSFSNRFISSEAVWYTHFAVNWTSKNWKIGVEIPVSYFSFSSIGGKKDILSKENLIANVAATGSYTFNSRLKAIVEWQRNTNFRAPYTIATNNFISSYRSFYRQDPFVKHITFNSFSFTLSYKDVVKSFFINGGVNINEQQQNFIANQQFMSSLLLNEWIGQNNESSFVQFFVAANKYLYKLKTGINGSVFYNRATSQQLQQQVMSTFGNASSGFKFATNTSLGFVNAEYKMDYRTFRSGISSAKEKNHTTFLNQFVVLSLNLPQNFILRFNGEQNDFTNSDNRSYTYYFADLSLRKKFSKPKIEGEFIWQNILNNRSYTTLQIYNNTQSLTSFQLRPAQVLLKVSYSF